MKRSIILHREADRYLNGKKIVTESVPGYSSRVHPSRGAVETAGRWHFLRCSQRMGMRYPGRMGSAEPNIWGDRLWYGESHGTQGTCHPGALMTASPTLARFCDPVCPQSNQAFHSQLFCLCASSLQSRRLYSTHHVLLSSLKFILVHLTGKGHVDPAQPLNDRSCPHTINIPKSKTFPWLQCIHRPKITLCPQHTKHPVCCGHDYFGHFAFPICLKH